MQGGEGRYAQDVPAMREYNIVWMLSSLSCADTEWYRRPHRDIGRNSRRDPESGGRDDAARRPTRRARAKKQKKSAIQRTLAKRTMQRRLHLPGPERFLQIGSLLSLAEAIRSRQTTLVHSMSRL